jgi:cysteine synthase A
MTAGGPRIVEVNGRLPGDEITALIRAATGLHLQREVVRLHAGEPPDLARTQRRAAAVRYLAAPRAGTLRAVEGLDEARRVPGVTSVVMDVGPGDAVVAAASNLDVLGHVVAVGAEPGDATRAADAALGQVTLRFDDDPPRAA